MGEYYSSDKPFPLNLPEEDQHDLLAEVEAKMLDGLVSVEATVALGKVVFDEAQRKAEKAAEQLSPRKEFGSDSIPDAFPV
jgi:hypothetical protein